MDPINITLGPGDKPDWEAELPFSEFPVAFASCSIGLPRHTLHQKIEAISAAGFQGIELSFPDLQSFASRHFSRDVGEEDYDALCDAGQEVRRLCASHGLKILVLQPFANFEGWAKDSPQREAVFERAKGWIRIMEAVGTDMLQVGSSDSTGAGSLADTAAVSRKELAEDLGALADLLAARGFRLAYENWCWATRAPGWRDVWEIVQQANRPNIGLCLDTFQSAGGEWADPTTESGLVEDVSEEEREKRWKQSLRDLATTVPAHKVYFLQISDAYRVQPPLAKEPNESGLRPRGRWSHDHRTIPYDGGYLPVLDFVEAVLATQFRGWFSIEVFDGKFEEKFGDDLPRFAKRAMESHKKLLGEVSQTRIDNKLA